MVLQLSLLRTASSGLGFRTHDDPGNFEQGSCYLGLFFLGVLYFLTIQKLGLQRHSIPHTTQPPLTYLIPSEAKLLSLQENAKLGEPKKFEPRSNGRMAHVDKVVLHRTAPQTLYTDTRNP